MFKQYGESIDVVFLTTDSDEVENDESSNVETATADDAEVDLDVVQPFMQDENGESLVSEILTFDNNNVDVDANVDGEADDINNYFEANPAIQNEEPRKISLPAQRRCVSHLLNLVSKDFEKQLTGNAKTAYYKTFDAFHSLWVIVRFSTRAKTICREMLGTTLMLPTETRWNSKFDCVKQCNKVEIQRKLNEFILALKAELNLNSAKQQRIFTAHDFLVMAEYE